MDLSVILHVIEPYLIPESIFRLQATCKTLKNAPELQTACNEWLREVHTTAGTIDTIAASPVKLLAKDKSGLKSIYSDDSESDVLESETDSDAESDEERVPPSRWRRFTKPPFDTLNPLVCAIAANRGDLDILRELRRKNYAWDALTLTSAAANGHLDVLGWALENGCLWDQKTCREAASGGHLETLKWARENGFPWDEETCAHAALGGHLEVLKWARENGCPWDGNTRAYATYGGHAEVLKWARENDCP